MTWGVLSQGGGSPARYLLEWRDDVISSLHSQFEAGSWTPRHHHHQTHPSRLTSSFDHLDAVRVRLVENLHAVDLPDEVPGP